MQQCAFYIIMGSYYNNYDEAVNFLGSEKLCVSRTQLCLSFELKCEKNWFALSKVNEVPNQKPEVISLASLSTRKYQQGLIGT